MSRIFNLAKMTVSGTPGTGTITLGSAKAGYLSLAGAGVADGQKVSVVIEDGGEREVRRDCVYTSSGTTLTRGTLVKSTTGSSLNLTSAAIVTITGLADDLLGANFKQVASASTCDIGAEKSLFIEITGTTTITSFGTTPNEWRMVLFAAQLTLTHNATSLIMPNNANLLTVAGDMAIFVSDDSGNWRCVNYFRKSGLVRFSPSNGQIADDSVFVFQPTGGATLFGSKIDFVGNVVASGYGGYHVRAASSPTITLMYGANLTIAAAGTVLTGTTGTDGQVTISSDSSGNVYVENRRGTTIGMVAYVYL
jgi:hypothetical protein